MWHHENRLPVINDRKRCASLIFGFIIVKKKKKNEDEVLAVPFSFEWQNNEIELTLGSTNTVE